MENIQNIINLLKKGKIGVMPTDTIYGIVGSALNLDTVEEIYRLRKRSFDKPMIILISSINDLKKFDIKLTQKQKDFLRKIWPNPISVVLPCSSESFRYLHREVNTLAFRIPRDDRILEILKVVGPLVAPSANFEGEKPSETIVEAKKYFEGNVFYEDGGKIKSQASTLISLNNDGTYNKLREGSFKISRKQFG